MGHVSLSEVKERGGVGPFREAVWQNVAGDQQRGTRHLLPHHKPDGKAPPPPFHGKVVEEAEGKAPEDKDKYPSLSFFHREAWSSMATGVSDPSNLRTRHPGARREQKPRRNLSGARQ